MDAEINVPFARNPKLAKIPGVRLGVGRNSVVTSSPHPSSSVADKLGGRETRWSAEEMLDGLRQRLDIPAHARTANKGLLQNRLAGLC